MTYKEAFKEWLEIQFTFWAMDNALLYGVDYANKHCNAENFLKEHTSEDLWQEFIEFIESKEIRNECID